jgi:peptidoglycan/LPS O-acetylase OafA/YrhL
MVLGGGVSFALYLVHVPLLKLFRDALDHDAVPLSPHLQMYGELVVAAVSLLIAWALFRHVEEPARHRLRALGPYVVAFAGRLRVPARPPEIVPVSVGLEHRVDQQARRVGV